MSTQAHSEALKTRAAQALSAGNWKAAFATAASGLQHPPHENIFVEVIETAYKRAGGGAALIDPGALDYEAAIALSVGMASMGALQEASGLLCKALVAAPGAFGAGFLLKWMEQGAAPDPLLGSLLMGVGTPMIGRIYLRPAERALCERYAPVAKALLRVKNVDPNALLAASGLLRRAGDTAGALACVQRLEQLLSPVPSAVYSMKGLALRLEERCNEAVAAFEQGKRTGLHPITARCEIARAYFDDGRWREARTALAEPEQDDVEQVAMGQWLDEQLRGEQQGHAHRVFGAAPNSDAFRLASYPGQADFRAPRDLAIQMIENTPAAERAKLQIAMAKMDCPSTRAAVALVQCGVPDPSQANYRFAELTKIDPRVCGDEAEPLSVWVYRGAGTMPFASGTAPGAEVLQAIAQLRAAPKSLRCWWPLAHDLGRWLGPNRVMELFGACTSAPVLARGEFAPDAFYEQQLAALMLLANIDDGWEGSLRRRVLLGMLAGPVDWTTACAVLAATEVALDVPSAGEDIRYAFERLPPRIPTLWSWMPVVLKACYGRVPGVSSQVAKEFKESF